MAYRYIYISIGASAKKKFEFPQYTRAATVSDFPLSRESTDPHARVYLRLGFDMRFYLRIYDGAIPRASVNMNC